MAVWDISKDFYIILPVVLWARLMSFLTTDVVKLSIVKSALWLIHPDECLIFSPAGRIMWNYFSSLVWSEMNGQQQREMRCLCVHSSLPDWGVKDGGVTWLVISLFVQSSEGSHRQIANRRCSIWDFWIFDFGFYQLKTNEV